jgi:hypothetical protein
MIAALKARLSSGPVGTKTIRERRCMEESPAIQELFFNTGNEPYSQYIENVDFIVLQTDIPLTIDADGVVLTCNSLMVWDQPVGLFHITSTDFNTNVQLVVGRRG